MITWCHFIFVIFELATFGASTDFKDNFICQKYILEFFNFRRNKSKVSSSKLKKKLFELQLGKMSKIYHRKGFFCQIL